MSVANIKTDNFKRQNVVDIILLILCINFIVSMIGAMVSDNVKSSVPNREYHTVQLEYNTYDDIFSIKVDKKRDRLFVFYQNAAVLNVYNLKGKFEWAVAIPRQPNGCANFFFNDDTVLLTWYEGYEFDSVTGKFLRLIDEDTISCDEKLDYEALQANYEKNDAEAEKLGYSFALTDLWYEQNGITKNIIDKPLYYIFFNSFIFWAFGFSSGLLVGLIALINRFKGIKKVQIDASSLRKCVTTFVSIEKALFVAQVIYATLFVPIMLLYPDFSFSLAIFGITISFIILGIISMNWRESTKHPLAEMEEAYIGKWSGMCVLGLAADFIVLVFSTFFE